MLVHVRLFAVARERVGRAALDMELPAHATLADLKEALSRAHPDLQDLMAHLKFAVDQEYAEDDHVLTSACEVAVIPPVSGGSNLRQATNHEPRATPCHD
jgi:molybdopterin converting factor subunit 1